MLWLLLLVAMFGLLLCEGERAFREAPGRSGNGRAQAGEDFREAL